jgi:uncharacterized 2Fe-2S/4Fe-4S cluster protein (DUF4445 family)
MAEHKITLLPQGITVEVPTGALLVEAIERAGLGLNQPCGGQGRCGRCAVVVEDGAVRRRSVIRLSAADVAAGYALACQTVVEGDARVLLPPQEQIERRLVTDKSARPVEVPFAYDPRAEQCLRVLELHLDPPSLADNLDDERRLLKGVEAALRLSPPAAQGAGGREPRPRPSLVVPLVLRRNLGGVLRQGEWNVSVVVETETWSSPRGVWRIIDVVAGEIHPYGLAVDIGTTTVTVYLVDLLTGEAVDQAAEYNGQIARGEDVISRIVYAGKGDGLEELGGLVRSTVNTLIERVCGRRKVDSQRVYRLTVAGNTTMTHLLLGVPPGSIRLSPYIPAFNQPQPVCAGEIGLEVNPLAAIDCLPGVASYVGSDITAGVLAVGMMETEELTLFIDVGTNGEIALGTRDWMVSCACSAGPAFEGAGVVCGMRATVGAIEEVWVSSETLEPTVRVIGGGKARGLCGSALLSLLAELFVTAVVDRSGKFKLDCGSTRVREGEHGGEYVVTWAAETATGKDIFITQVDVENLLRAKAAIYAGFSVLAASVGLDLKDVQRVVIGGSFGKYLNIEKAIQIGLMPDLPWERFRFLGNTSIKGAYMALLSREARAQIQLAAEKMTYVELSADNTFYDAFTAALFLPHTEIARFPSVASLWEQSGPRRNGKGWAGQSQSELAAAGSGNGGKA